MCFLQQRTHTSKLLANYAKEKNPSLFSLTKHTHSTTHHIVYKNNEIFSLSHFYYYYLFHSLWNAWFVGKGKETIGSLTFFLQFLCLFLYNVAKACGRMFESTWESTDFTLEKTIFIGAQVLMNSGFSFLSLHESFVFGCGARLKDENLLRIISSEFNGRF